MTVFALMVLAGVLLCGAGLLLLTMTMDRDRFAAPMMSILMVVIGFVLAALGVGFVLSKHYNRIECQTFARQTHRKTRFVVYSTFSWDCITPTRKGKWIPTDNLREFGSN